MVLGGCSTQSRASAPSSTIDPPSGGEGETTEVPVSTAGGFLDSAHVHAIDLGIDAAAFTGMLAAFRSSGDKEWVEATVTIDGLVYDRAGARLKGNSSLRSVANDESVAIEDLPWLLRLDKFVDGQRHQGIRDIVVRSNTTVTAMNEAVALDLLGAAGLASQRTALTRLSANGGDPALRLTMEHPGDDWAAREFASSGVLYKAEAGGDYSYRGTEPSSYEEIFDQETGDDDNLAPLMTFLKFINDSSDSDFASGIKDRVDFEAFATYLAFQDVVDNFDDIDGPGNNSYLWWDEDSLRMTVVAWDHNLAFGTRNAGGGGPGAGGPAGGGRERLGDGNIDGPPSGGGAQGAPPGGAQALGAGPGGPRGARSNVLVTRCTALTEFTEQVAAETVRLKGMLASAEAGGQSLAKWSALILAEAGDLVAKDVVVTEGAAIGRYLTG